MLFLSLPSVLLSPFAWGPPDLQLGLDAGFRHGQSALAPPRITWVNNTADKVWLLLSLFSSLPKMDTKILFTTAAFHLPALKFPDRFYFQNCSALPPKMKIVSMERSR